MLLHHGATVEVGHYTAIVRVGGQCFTCDDQTVTPSTSHQLSDAGRSVYICLYEKTGLWFLYYLYPLRTHVFLFAVTAHLYPFFSFEQLYCSTNPIQKAAITFAFVRSDTYTCGIAEARESCSALQYGLAQLRHRRRFNRRIVQQYGSDVDWRQAGYCWYTRVCAYAVSI